LLETARVAIINTREIRRNGAKKIAPKYISSRFHFFLSVLSNGLYSS